MSRAQLERRLRLARRDGDEMVARQIVAILHTLAESDRARGRHRLGDS
jgi:hypothetical protein